MKVYILLTDTGSLLTRVIKMCTKKPYNHISIAFNEELTDIYSFGRKNPNNPFIGGFVKEDLTAKIFKSAACELYSFEVTEYQYKRMREKVQEMENDKDKYRYNFLGLLAALVHLDIPRKNTYFCSQFVLMILEEAGIKATDISMYRVSPHDIKEYESLDLIYKGSLQKYLGR